jgi:hypothetical protein
LAKTTLNENSQIKFKGSLYNVQEFMEKFEMADVIEAVATMQVLVDRGSAFEYKNETKEQKVFNKAIEEEEIKAAANTIDAETERAKDFRAQKARDGRLVYPRIRVAYPTYTKATGMKGYFREKLRLKDSQMEIREKNGAVYLIFYNITDAELNFINRVYASDKVINAAVNTADQTVGKITETVDYVAKKIASPALEIGARGIVGILKTVVGVASKTGATLINAGSAGIKQTAKDLKEDPDIIRARRELINGKNSVARKFSGIGGTSSGIDIGEFDDDDLDDIDTIQ